MLQEKEREIDLLPHEWKATDDRRKPHEPFFGPGVWDAVLYVLGFTASAMVVRYFIL